MMTWAEIINEIFTTLRKTGLYNHLDRKDIEKEISYLTGENSNSSENATIFDLNHLFKNKYGYSDGYYTEYSELVYDEDGNIEDWKTLGYDVSFSFSWTVNKGLQESLMELAEME